MVVTKEEHKMKCTIKEDALMFSFYAFMQQNFNSYQRAVMSDLDLLFWLKYFKEEMKGMQDSFDQVVELIMENK